MTQSTHENDATHQASLWQAKLASDLVTNEQQQEFEIWLTQSDENLAAWQTVNAFWNQLDNLSSDDIDFMIPFDEAATEPSEQPDKLDFQPVQAQIKKSAFINKPVLPRALMAVAASVLLLFSVFFTQMPQYFADYHTAPGELRTLSLSDGSQIIMNSDTTLSIDYTQQQRNISLHKGEAYFSVAADSSRPFIVSTSTGKIRALGTEFDIKNRGNKTFVTVFEHAVQVSLANGSVIQSLAEGQQLSFSEQSFSKPSAVNLSRTQSWRKQRIVFQDKPLADVLAELSHYRAGRIIILDDKIKTLSVTGVFATDDTNIALQTIAQTLPVKVQKFTEKIVLISAK